MHVKRMLFSGLLALGITSWTAKASGQQLTTKAVVGRDTILAHPAQAPTPALAQTASAAHLFAQARPHLEAVLGHQFDNSLNFQEITSDQAGGLVRQCYPG